MHFSWDQPSLVVSLDSRWNTVISASFVSQPPCNFLLFANKLCGTLLTVVVLCMNVTSWAKCQHQIVLLSSPFYFLLLPPPSLPLLTPLSHVPSGLPSLLPFSTNARYHQLTTMHQRIHMRLSRGVLWCQLFSRHWLLHVLSLLQ